LPSIFEKAYHPTSSAVCVQVAQLQAEVSSKQAQLQALHLEHMALAAKARALDQLLASAGAMNTCGAVME
jgi:hypothetical protein